MVNLETSVILVFSCHICLELFEFLTNFDVNAMSTEIFLYSLNIKISIQIHKLTLCERNRSFVSGQPRNSNRSASPPRRLTSPSQSCAGSKVPQSAAEPRNATVLASPPEEPQPSSEMADPTTDPHSTRKVHLLPPKPMAPTFAVASVPHPTGSQPAAPPQLPCPPVRLPRRRYASSPDISRTGPPPVHSSG